jgi:hypothetical protein
MLWRWPAVAERRFVRLGPIASGQAARQVKAGAQDPRWMVEEVQVRRKLVKEEWKAELGGSATLASAEHSCGQAVLGLWSRIEERAQVTRDAAGRHEVRQGACRRVVRREVHGRSARLPGLGARLRSLWSLPSPRGPPRSRRGVRTPERAGLDAWRRERQRARDARA